MDASLRSMFGDGPNTKRLFAPWDAIASEAKRQPVTTGLRERSEEKRS